MTIDKIIEAVRLNHNNDFSLSKLISEMKKIREQLIDEESLSERIVNAILNQIGVEDGWNTCSEGTFARADHPQTCRHFSVEADEDGNLSLSLYLFNKDHEDKARDIALKMVSGF